MNHIETDLRNRLKTPTLDCLINSVSTEVGQNGPLVVFKNCRKMYLQQTPATVLIQSLPILYGYGKTL